MMIQFTSARAPSITFQQEDSVCSFSAQLLPVCKLQTFGNLDFH